MAITERWTEHDGLKLRWLDTGEGDGSTPVVFVPGMGESVDEFRWLLEALSPRRVVAVDVRGRGRSDAPDTGYTWEDHYGDIAAVVADSQVGPFAGMAISRGSSYLLGYALTHDDVRGVFVGDYFARHVGFPAEMAETHKLQVIRDVPMSERMPDRAVEGVFRDSREVPLWDRLPELQGPVWVVRGTRRSTLVTDAVAEQWTTALPSVHMHVIEGAGHDLWSRDHDTFVAVARDYLADVEASIGAGGV